MLAYSYYRPETTHTTPEGIQKRTDRIIVHGESYRDVQESSEFILNRMHIKFLWII